MKAQELRVDDFRHVLEGRLEYQLAFAIENWQNMSRQDLAVQPSPGSWSAQQCFSHLNSYSLYYWPYLEKAKGDKGKKEAKTYRPSRVAKFLLRATEPHTRSKPIKARRKHFPLAGEDDVLVIGKHIEYQENLIRWVRDARFSWGSKIPTSIFNWLKLNPWEATHFMLLHQERHYRQACRIHALSYAPLPSELGI